MTLPVIKYVLGNPANHKTVSAILNVGQASIEVNYNNTSADNNDQYGFYVQYDDSLSPDYIFVNSNTTGIMVNTMSTTTTVPPEPDSAELIFTDEQPVNGSNSRFLTDGSPLTQKFTIELGDNNLTDNVPIPYRVKISITDELNGGLFITDVINDTGGDNEGNGNFYTDGGTIIRDNFTSQGSPIETIYDVQMIAQQNKIASASLNIILETDINFNGNFIETSTLNYTYIKTGSRDPELS